MKRFGKIITAFAALFVLTAATALAEANVTELELVENTSASVGNIDRYYVTMLTSGDTSLTLREDDLRFYGFTVDQKLRKNSDNTQLLITLPEGYRMKTSGSVRTDGSGAYVAVYDYKNDGTTVSTTQLSFAASSSGYSTSIDTAYTTGNQLLIFSRGASYISFSVYVELIKDIPLTEDPVNPGVYYTTYYDSTRNCTVGSPAEVFSVSAKNDGALQLESVASRAVKKGEGVVIKAATNTVTLSFVSDSYVSSYSYDSILTGTDTETVPTDKVYVLGYSETTGVGFLPLNDGSSVGAHKAYFKASSTE